MNEEIKKDDLLAAFENLETDPTPDIAPVMPEALVRPISEPIINPMPINNMIAPEFQEAVNQPIVPEPIINEVPVNNMVTPELQYSIEPKPIVADTPEIAVVPEPVVSPVVDVAPVVESSVDPAISLAQQEKKVESDPIQDDPKFLKKNLKFILILCGVILAFILLLPKIMGILGTKF